MNDPRPPQTGWRSGGPAAGPASRRGGRLAAAFVALLAAAGGLAGLWFWVRPPEPVRFVTVPVGEYTDAAWPPNPWAEQDSERLRLAFPGAAEKAFNFQERDRLFALLDALKPDRNRPVVLHVTALAAERDGRVYLLPGNAKADDPAGWIALGEVLTAFAAGGARHKLLLLDVVKDRPLDALDAALAAVPPGVAVFASCSPGEVSLPMDEVQASAFAHFLAVGLTGEANADDDGRVSADELAKYVTEKVGAWAARTRGRPQTPKLYGKVGDFPLTFDVTALSEPPPPRGYPAWLAAGWARRDELVAGGWSHTAPAALNALDRALVRAERAWEAGFEGRAERRLAGDLDELRPAFDAARPAAAPANAPPSPQKAELDKAFKAWLTARVAVPLPKPEELLKLRDALKPKEPAADNPLEGFVWEAAIADQDPLPEKLRDLAAVLTEAGAPPLGRDFALRRAAAWEPTTIRWPGPAVHAFLQSEQASALPPDGAGFPWVRDRLDTAVRVKRDGEQALFAARTGESARAAAGQLDAATRDLRAARTQLDTLAAARRELDDASRLLVATADEVSAGGVLSEALWRSLAGAVVQLADRVDRPPGPFPDLDGPLVDLKAARAAFERHTAPARLAAKPSEYPALRSLLRGPLLPAADRKAVWTAANQLAIKLAANPETATPPPPPARPADLAGDLARLAGTGGDALPAAVRAARVAVTPGPGVPPAVRLAAEERRAWLAWLAVQARAAADVRKDVAGARAYYEGLAADFERAGRP